jgi:hypothetical protein
VGGDGGKWLRRQCLVLAQTNNTPVPYWLSLTIPDFCAWLRASNQIQQEMRESAKKAKDAAPKNSRRKR